MFLKIFLRFIDNWMWILFMVMKGLWLILGICCSCFRFFYGYYVILVWFVKCGV